MQILNYVISISAIVFCHGDYPLTAMGEKLVGLVEKAFSNLL
jgi:hypothetical protein